MGEPFIDAHMLSQALSAAVSAAHRKSIIES
jgi:hypothetical protein